MLQRISEGMSHHLRYFFGMVFEGTRVRLCMCVCWLGASPSAVVATSPVPVFVATHARLYASPAQHWALGTTHAPRPPPPPHTPYHVFHPQYFSSKVGPLTSLVSEYVPSWEKAHRVRDVLSRGDVNHVTLGQCARGAVG